MDSTEFIHRLQGMRAGEILAIAGRLDDAQGSADGEVAWWRATIAVSGALRRGHRTRQASLAAHDAATAVGIAAGAVGLDQTARDQVTAVARAAAEAARLLVAGGWPALGAEVGLPLLHPFGHLDRDLATAS